MFKERSNGNTYLPVNCNTSLNGEETKLEQIQDESYICEVQKSSKQKMMIIHGYLFLACSQTFSFILISPPIVSYGPPLFFTYGNSTIAKGEGK